MAPEPAPAEVVDARAACIVAETLARLIGKRWATIEFTVRDGHVGQLAIVRETLQPPDPDDVM